MKKFIILILLIILSFQGFTEVNDSLKFKISIRVGVSYNQFGRTRNNFNKLSYHRSIIFNTFNPFLGFSYIHNNIFKNSCCDFARVEFSVSANRTNLKTHFPLEKNPTVSGRPTFIYSTLSLFYGWKIKARWRLSPFLSVHYRSFDFIKESDKSAITDFGIYNEDVGFTNNIKKADLSLGGSVTFKVNPQLYLQADLSYGFLPQITLNDLPKIYQAYSSLTAGYIFKHKKS